MKLTCILLLLFSLNTHAQIALNFDKNNADCEDKWVAYQKDEKETSYIFGFIYIDPDAGLTFNYEGRFEIDNTGKFIPSKAIKELLKARLEPHNGVIAIIPDEKLPELGVKTVPDWLAIYKQGENTVNRLHRWGFYYNSYDMSAKALTYLEKAYQLEPKFAGLEFEIGYAYNALGQFSKAAEFLTKAIATSPNECYLYKELSFAHIHLGKIDEASKVAYKGIEVCDDKAMKAEIAFNIAGNYFNKKDLSNFNLWVKETRKWVVNGDQYSKILDDMQSKIQQRY